MPGDGPEGSGRNSRDLKAHWPGIKEELLAGRHQPGAVRRQPLFDPDFSERSYGFRPGRNAHQAVREAQALVGEGRPGLWKEDCPTSCWMNWTRSWRGADTPSAAMPTTATSTCGPGGPERVLASVTRYLHRRLKLEANLGKSAVDRPWKRKYLGYSMTSHRAPRLRVAPQSVGRFKAKLRELFRSGWGRNLRRFIQDLTPAMRGWVDYFRLADAKGIFEELDEWIRRKLRVILWR